MSYCSKCGAEVVEEDQFCSDCGASRVNPQASGTSLPTLEHLEETIPELKTIVYKTLVDPSTVKLIGEKEKVNLFTKMGILKPKPEEIQFEALEKYYEPYFVINGRYFLDYYRKRVYTLDVEADVSEIVILNQVFKPQAPSKLTQIRRKTPEIELETDQRIIMENSSYLALDRKSREVKIEELTTAPSEAHPKKVLENAGDRVWQSEVSPKEVLDLFQTRVLTRPTDIEKINRELLEVSEYTRIFIPIYQATYKHLKSNQEKTLLINGVTSTIQRTD